MAAAGKICKPGNSGLFLPLTDGENHFPHDWLRGLLYAFAMAYFFMGIANVADIFMSSIEVITNKRVQRILSDGTRRTSKVWNETVATLSLMALGSSAPEIFLAVIELFKKEMHTGELGPSVIVGSAAFNFFVIIAVCIAVIPQGEMRRIENLPAFITTAVFSAIAYVWLVFILIIHTPDIVDVGEGIATFLFLPLLVWVSYSVDVGVIGAFFGLHNSPPKIEPVVDLDPEDGGTGSTKETGLSRILFRSEMVTVKASMAEQVLQVFITRQGCSRGVATCAYHTESLSAVPGLDYEECEGRVEFCDGKDEASVSISICSKMKNRGECKLILILDELEGSAQFDPERDGGEDLAIMTISIDSHLDQSFWGNVTAIMSFRLLDWLDQFNSNIYCNGSADAQKDASVLDWVCHIVALPWKLAFSFIPPASYFDGWPCFCISICGIGLLTALVSDLAELFGCVLGLADIVTAITFVALGTSMPDLFASRSAAIEDPTADASVVNVTGSNSVNVFLGLGLPWTIASIYWPSVGRSPEWVARYPDVAKKISGAAFVVESRDFGFSVVVYCVCALIAVVLLVMRRKIIGAVLGGPFWPKVATSFTFVMLWISFVGLTSWRALRKDQVTSGETIAVISCTAFALVCTAAWPITVIMLHRRPVSSPVVKAVDTCDSESLN